MPEIEQISLTDSGRVAFEKTERNFQKINESTNLLLGKTMRYRGESSTMLYENVHTGIYLTRNTGVVDLPAGWPQGRYVLISVNPENDLYGYQLLTTYPGSSGKGTNRKIAIRHAITEGSAWVELATHVDASIAIIKMLPDTITKLSDLNDYGLWITEGNAQAVKITDMPAEVAGKSFRVENKPTVASGGVPSRNYIEQILTCYNDGNYKGVFVRHRLIDGRWTEWRKHSSGVNKNLSLLNGWRISGSMKQPSVTVSGDIAVIDGYIEGGTQSDGTTIFNLPAEARPKRTQVLKIVNNNGSYYNSRIVLGTNGDVKIYGVNTTSWISLSGCTYTLF